MSLNKHLLPVLGAVHLTNLTDPMIRGWRNGLVVESADPEKVRRSRDTANRLLSIAKAVLNFAYRGGLVADDRAWRRVEPFRGVGQSRKIILDDAQLQRLIDSCDPGLRELVALGAWTGARLGELASCRVNDFDAADGTLAVNGKTGPRTIFLPPAAILLLRRLAAGKRPDAYLLTTASGKRWVENHHHLPFRAATAKAGLPVGTTYYTLRHAFISRALRQTGAGQGDRRFLRHIDAHDRADLWEIHGRRPPALRRDRGAGAEPRRRHRGGHDSRTR